MIAMTMIMITEDEEGPTVVVRKGPFLFRVN